MPRLLGLAVGAWFAGVAVLAQGPGLFAKEAEPVTSGRTSLRSGGRVAVSTANGSSAFPATLLVTRDGGRLERSFEFGLNAEVLWSPDGSRFAVTGSEGGANGQYRTVVVTIAGDRLGWFDVTPMVERAFGHPVKCGYPDPRMPLAPVTEIGAFRIVSLLGAGGRRRQTCGWWNGRSSAECAARTR
jgi:hypothetical protein